MGISFKLVFLLLLLIFIAFFTSHFKGKVYPEESIRTLTLHEETIKEFLPNLNYSWSLTGYDESNCLSTPSEIPRIPKLAFRKDISAKIGDVLATPLVEGEKIFLVDNRRIYVLNERTGGLVWGVEIYSDSIENRGISELQQLMRWRTLGFRRYIRSYGIGRYFFVGTSSTEEDNGYLLAFNKSSGELIWRAELSPGGDSVTYATSNLMVADGKVCVGTGTARGEGYVFCFTEEGDLLWRGKVGGNVRVLAYCNGNLFVTSELSKSIYVFDIKTGREIWRYDHVNTIVTLLCKDEKVFFIDDVGHLVSLLPNGRRIWEKDVGGVNDIRKNFYIAIGDKIYISKSFDKKSLGLSVIDFNGNNVGKFKIEGKERVGAPVATKNVILLPVLSDNYAKVYFLWKGVSKLYEYKIEGDGIYMPRVSVAYGRIYVVSSSDGRDILVKLEDLEGPKIKDIKEVERRDEVEVKVSIQDKNSGIYKALIAYKDSKWHYIEMEPLKRHVIEPIGGYGFGEEDYIATVPSSEYVIIAIDNVGNYMIRQGVS